MSMVASEELDGQHLTWGPMEWGLLLARVRKRQVLPVIGPDLARVMPSPADTAAWGRPNSPLTIESYLALRVAHEWSKNGKHPVICPQDLPPDPRLNDLVCLYLDRGGSREGLDQFYGHVAVQFAGTTVVDNASAELPPGTIRLSETLVQLAEISDFGLFLTTAGDTLLERVLEKVRPGAKLPLPSPGFSNERPEDLPEVGGSRAPVVYHLFGQFDVQARSFVLTEDDLLDYVVSLQAQISSLGRLRDALRANQLLILGGGFPDWLARFVMRTAKPRLLNAEEILADEVAATDNSLCRFLQRFSPKTTVLPGGGAAFVATLHQKWKELCKLSSSVNETMEASLPPAIMPPKVAFISYASGNRDRARRLRAQLNEAGVDAWYDQEQLEAGDNWDAKIRLNVKRCAVFLPLISRETEARLEGYFRREWKAAADRRESIDDSVCFILPLLLDDGLQEATVQRVPKEFRVPQWGVCGNDGGIPESYVTQVKRAYQVWTASV